MKNIITKKTVVFAIISLLIFSSGISALGLQLKKIETKELTKVGVNRFQIEEEDRDLEVFEVDPNTISRQKERLAKVKAERDGKRVQEMLTEVGRAAVKGENLMPYIFNAVKAYATVGEIVKQLKEVYGEASLTGAF